MYVIKERERERKEEETKREREYEKRDRGRAVANQTSKQLFLTSCASGHDEILGGTFISLTSWACG